MQVGAVQDQAGFGLEKRPDLQQVVAEVELGQVAQQAAFHPQLRELGAAFLQLGVALSGLLDEGGQRVWRQGPPVGGAGQLGAHGGCWQLTGLLLLVVEVIAELQGGVLPLHPGLYQLAGPGGFAAP